MVLAPVLQAAARLPLLVVVNALLVTGVYTQEEAPRKIILKMSIANLQRESEGEILARLTIRIGDIYDRAKVNAATATLYTTGKFKSVTWQESTFEDGVAITFTVEERPLVKSVEFQGRDAFSLGDLREGLETEMGGLFSESSLQRDRELLREKYHEDGYIFATIETQETQSPGGVTVTFVIEEGSRVRIREIKFIGNKSIRSGTLLGVMNTREKDFWFFGLVRSGFYDEKTLREDLSNIKRYYQGQGHFDVLAEPSAFEFDRSKEWLTITIRIDEGPQYTFRGYRLAENTVFREETLLELTTAVPGQPFNADEVREDQLAIKNYYGDRAYIFAEVTFDPEFTLQGYDVFVRLDVKEENEIYIEEVRIQGNEKTQDRVIRRELEFYPGERVDRSKLEKSRSNLNRLQIFSGVDYTFESGSSPGDKTVVVNIQEVQAGRLILGFGVTSGFGIIGNFNIIKRNFNLTDWPESLYDIQDSFSGAGQTLNLQAQPGTLRSLYRFTLIEPYLFDTRNALRISASKLTIIRDDWDEDRASFDPQISHAFDFDRDFVFFLGQRLEEVEISRIDPRAPPDVFAVEGYNTVSALNTGVKYDKRLFEYLEGYFDGSLYALEYEYGGDILGGDVDFQKGELSNEFYYPIYATGSGSTSLHHVISWINRYGLIKPTSDATIPVFERFFVGGANTVRGFRFRGLGPHVNKEATGGTEMLFGNLEYSFPIFMKILRGVMFFDYGNLEPEGQGFDFSRMRYTTGAGLRVNFPFLGVPLPIGLYLGKALRTEETDREQLFLFTIGAPF